VTTLAHYTYLPWVRQGLATLIPQVDPLNQNAPGRAELPVRLRLDLEGTDAAIPDVVVRLQGPGDVIGLDPGQVLRTVPAAGAVDVEGNYFAHVELARVDLPWMLTPVAATTEGKLRPWLVLVAIEDRPGVEIVASASDLPDRLEIEYGAATELPPLAESWAWAHVQATGTVGGVAALQTLMEESPELLISRLICPRHLADHTAYHACVVPAFAAGVTAGLGRPLADTDFEDLAPAWTGAEASITLPVYHSWSFSTGRDGDFESITRRIQPYPMPETVGVRNVDVGHAGSGLPESAPDTGNLAGFLGALVSPAVAAPTWSDPHRQDFRDALRAMLDLSAGVQPDGPEDPIVGPPFYGRWHALASAVPGDDESPPWLRELNLDPTLRATAALGAGVVRKKQETLMQQAWEQIGEVLEANRKLRQAQLAREASRSAKARHFDTLPSDGMRVQVAGPALSRVPLTSGVTARGELRGSSVPSGTAGGALRRFARPAGPASRRAGSDNADWAGRLLSGLADSEDDLAVGNDLLPPSGMATTGHVASSSPPPGSSDDTLSELSTVFGDYESFIGNYRVTPAPDPNMTAVRDTVEAVLDPVTAVVARTATRIALPDGYWARAEPLDPVMAAPEFTRPMYGQVPDRWLVPGLDIMPDDAMGILAVNGAFIEAFMTGLSHEMARELLWREYPTDQRGTCFRQFWDVRGRIPPPASSEDIEAAKDIGLIHTWSAGELGTHLTGAGADPDGLSVVILRSVLLRRYPNTVVYMARAAWDGEARVPWVGADGEEHEFPLFTGRIGADVRFLGFGVSIEQARGGGLPSDTEPNPDPGWFVVFQEQPTEPRFGLDDGDADPIQNLDDWEDLGWSSVGAPDGAHLVIGAVDPAPTIDGITWGENGAHMARITLQTPVRVLFHADALLPEEGSP
jgi:hypothetical protein